MRIIFLCVNAVIFAAFSADAQIPVADFTIPSQVCLAQQVIPVNQSSNTVAYEWDFCQGDLALTPSVSYLGAIGGAITLGVDVVFDGANWYGFVTSRETNSIIRLDFGTDNTSVPVRTDLGNVGGNLGRPVDIRVVKDNGKWYAFVYSEATANTLITRVDFGSSLQNTTAGANPITSTVVLPGNGVFNSNGGFDMVQSGSGWTIVYTQPSSVGIIRLTTVTSIPSGADLQSGPALTGSVGSTMLGDIKLIKSANQWFGYTSDFQNRELYRLNFGPSIFSMPSSINLGGSWMNGQTPYGLDGGFDNGNYYLLVSTLSGNLQRINLGADLSSAPLSGTALGNFSLLSNTFKIKLLNRNSQWIAFTVDYSNQHFYRIPFPSGTCSTSPSFSAVREPAIVYTAPAATFITLRSFNTDGNFDESHNAVTVSSGTAPAIDFQTQNVCARFPVNFNPQSAQTLHSFQWNFGNGDTSAQATPSEIFNAPGTFTVSFAAVAPNGCSNLVKHDITIFNPPSASFTMPSPSLSCTNQQYVFTNTSAADAGSSPTWQWNVDSAAAAATVNLGFSFPTVSNHSVQLVATIPGCSTQQVQTFSVQQQGPTADFTAVGNCEDRVITFENTSTGNISGYTWDFGDGQTSSSLSPGNTYTSTGNYAVRLTLSNPLGCNNTVVKQVPVYSTPQAQFSLELPPFSCSGSPSQFTDITPQMTDSNISSWTWSFGDAGGGNSSDQNPVFTYADAGQYNVKLSLTTDRGCSASMQQQVTIEQTPVADFTATAACAGKPVQFSDASPPGTKSWAWSIDGTISTNQNPEHTFAAAGDYVVKLSATAPNSCIGNISRTITVPVPLSPVFSAANTCAGQDAEFTNTTTQNTDAVTSVLWDFNGEGSASGSSASFSFDEANQKIIKLSVQTQSGCVYSVTSPVVIHPAPAAEFSVSVVEGAAPLPVKFTNTSSGATSFTWSIDGTNSNAVSPSYTFDEEGEYTVELIAVNADGCRDRFSDVVRVLAPEEEMVFDPWPVPARGMLYLEWNLPVSGTMEVALYTLLGVRAGDRHTVSSVAGRNRIAVDVSALPPGIYIAEVHGQRLDKKFRIIVE